MKRIGGIGRLAFLSAVVIKYLSKDAPASAGGVFAFLKPLRQPYFGNTNLAVTIYCVPL